MSKRNLIIVSSLGAVLGMSALARAQGGERFGLLDQNHDGVVSMQEFEAHALAKFAEADANHDGKVSPEERSAQRERQGKARFAEQDINHDGVLERAELERMPAALFHKIDTDKSGGLNQNEMKSFFKAKHAEARAAHGQAAAQVPDAPRSQAEVLAKVRAKFAKLDANKDGRLVEDELAQGHHCEGNVKS
ncbi:MAG: hypothetical protein QM778_16130 [Myxococcales bacterium]